MQTQKHSRYPHVFSPIRLGPVEVPTRYYFAPHGSVLAVGTAPSDDLIAFSAERVSGGGCGLVIIATAAHERARTNQPSPHPDENVPAFKAYADAIHEAGGKAFAELLYWWGGYGRWQPFGPPAPAFGPSVRQFAYRGRTNSTHELSREELDYILKAHRHSAANLRRAGFDGIMLHGSHAALIEQFLSPYFNERDDEFGGDPQRRLSMLLRLLEVVREGAGDDLAVGIRLNCDELLPGGYHTDAASNIVGEITARGLVDFVDLDLAVEPQQLYYGMPTSFTEPHLYRPYVEAVRSAARNVPVLSVLGRVTSMADAEAAIASGVCDMVGSARQLIAEPRFVQNARHGHEQRSRTCIACNWCMAAGAENALGCAINPASYRERLWGVATLTKAGRACRVVVVGGGPAGLEAARVAALRGHEVVLFEQRQELGGALRLWSTLPGRGTYGAAIDWWAAELDRLGVEIRLGVEADEAAVLAERPDAVIVATGARYSRGGRSFTFDADLPGHDLPHVLRPEDVLVHGQVPTGRVLVLDAEGLHTGVGIAELLATRGATVTLVSPNFSPVSTRLVENFEVRFIMQRLHAAGVTFIPSTWAIAVNDGDVRLYDVYTADERVITVDSVVLAGGRVPHDRIARRLAGRVTQLYTVGDAMSARMLAAATYEGHKFARVIGVDGAPRSVGEAYFQRDPAEYAMAVAGSRR